MPQVAAAVEALDAAHVAEVMADGGEVGINVDGDEHTLGPDEVTLALQPLEGYEVEAEAGHAVALQLELDDELRREGLAREIVHAVQNARKEAGLEITDRIELALGGDEELLAAARAHEAYLAGEVLATSVAYDAGDGAAGRDRRPRAADRGEAGDCLTPWPREIGSTWRSLPVLMALILSLSMAGSASAAPGEASPAVGEAGSATPQLLLYPRGLLPLRGPDV